MSQILNPKFERYTERLVLRSVMELLRARGIFFLRINTGAFKNSAGQHVKFGHPGCSDIIAFRRGKTIFIECKASDGRQSKDQAIFESLVLAEGFSYLIITTAMQLNIWLEENNLV
jgi:hypothetical protein